MKTIFPKKESHVPKWFVIDASGKTLGRLATEASKLLRGKEISYYTPGIDQGNYVIILNADKVVVSGKKETQKLYYRTSQRPGSLKTETFQQLQKRIPTRIIEKAIWGMLPKGVLGRQYYRRLYIYAGNQINYKKTKNLVAQSLSLDNLKETNWQKITI
ncbi:MAG: 50S ribosomal protein L13 [Alphaproteobacteria bacterium]|nr:50S ribosomal protein L13 [Alphaproteobacteria bacterium]